MEELARNYRYDFFEKIRQKYDAAWIITAHHHDDQIETTLFNLIRGASYNGLKGIRAIDEKRYLLRPLLHVGKKEILNWLKKHRQKFCTDLSNKDIRFSRNLLRQKIIPLFSKINPGFEKTFTENLENFTQIAEYLDQKTQQWLDQNYTQNTFPLHIFLEQPVFFQKNLLSQLYQKFYNSTDKLNQNHLNNIINLLKQKKSNRQKEFGSHFMIKIIKLNKKSDIEKNTPSQKEKNPGHHVTFIKKDSA